MEYIRIWAHRSYAHIHAYELRFYKEDWDGKKQIARPITLEFEEWKEGVGSEPTLTLDGIAARELCQYLTSNGIRTDNDSEIAGKLMAQSAHLQDLRHLLKLPPKGDTPC